MEEILEKIDLNTSFITDDDFGPLLPFKNDSNITDINWNGRQLWIDDVTRGRYLSDVVLDQRFIDLFTQRIMNRANKSFNPYTQLLEAETDELRISIIHESAAVSGRSISIRKSPAKMILSREYMIDEEYATPKILDMIQAFVKAKCNTVICGLPGVGKTELLKWMTKFIPADQRVITIEDNLEIHYSTINPGKDSVELKVSLDEDEGMTYSDAIKAALRQLPTWILLSEARGVEAKELLKSLLTGCYCLTTLHTDDVRKVPYRIRSMAGVSLVEYEDEIYEGIDVGILINETKQNGIIKRYISQIAVYTHTIDGKNETTMIVDKGKVLSDKQDLLHEILKKLNKAENLDQVNKGGEKHE